MAVKMLSVVLLAASLAGSISLAQIGGPSNLPPASFKGQQFVDSRGCLYLRAGFGGTVNWVARLDRTHKPICGMPPTGSAAAQAAVAADMAPDTLASAQATQPAATQSVPTASATVAEAQTPLRKGFNLAGLFGMGSGAAAPSPAPAPTMMAGSAPVKAPVAQAAISPAYQTADAANLTGGVQCYPDAPKLERVKIAGGTALVCTQGNGSTAGWRPPSFGSTGQAQVAAVTAPLMTAPVQVVAPQPVAMAAPVVSVVAMQVMATATALQPAARSAALPKPPKGWVYAWKDDRLNPLRGIGTAAGQAQQDLVWQRTVPMVLVTDQAPRRGLARIFAVKTTVSTMSAPSSPVALRPANQAAGGLRVQVGTFGDRANAVKVTARLASLGLPVQAQPLARNGKALQIVYAGPFATTALASSALASIHGAGFTDATLR